MPEGQPAAPVAPQTKAAEPAAPAQKLSPAAQPSVKDLAAKVLEGKEKPPVDDKPGESKTAILARIRKEEAELYRRQQKWKQDQAAKDSELTQLRKYAQLGQEAERLAKTDPLKYLEFGGHKFEDVAKLVMKGDQRPTEDIVNERVKAAIDELKKNQASVDDERRKQGEKENEERMVTHAKSQMKDMVDEEPERYESIASNPSAIDKAWKVVEQAHLMSFERTGKGVIIDFHEALDIVEESQYKSDLERYRSSKKIKAALEEEKKAALEKDAQAKASKTGRIVPKAGVAQAQQQEGVAQTPFRRESSFSSAYIQKLRAAAQKPDL